MKAIYQHKKVAEFAAKKLGKTMLDVIKDSEFESIKELKVKEEFVDGDSCLQSAWVNNTCIGIADVFEGEANMWDGNTYEKQIETLIKEGLTR